MQENKSLFWKNSMNFGAIVGLAFIVYAVILFVLDLNNSTTAGFFNYVLLIAGIYIGTKQFRDHYNNGIITYANALGSGTLIALFAAIILGFYMYIFIKVIDPDAIEKMISLAEEKMISKGIPDDQIEAAMEINKKFMTPGMIAIWTVPVFTFFGFIFSLITSAILKKEGDPFQADMQQIDNKEE
ncbi:MAG: DUF4199 domain-containing protein [Chlorobi bacterium]|nr:DUF4199 domain-containing protein [Chlorobiota bacterium]